jgi:hypothetical protein
MARNIGNAITLEGNVVISVRIGRYNRTRRVYLWQLLMAAADDPACAVGLERDLTDALKRLRATREREAAKVVSLAERRSLSVVAEDAPMDGA